MEAEWRYQLHEPPGTSYVRWKPLASIPPPGHLTSNEMAQPQPCFVLADDPNWAFPDVLGVIPELGAALWELPDDRFFEDLVELFNHDHRSRRFGLKKVMVSALSTVKMVLAGDQIDRAGRILRESEYYPADPIFVEIGKCSSLLGDLAGELVYAVSNYPDGIAANLKDSPACFLLAKDPKCAFPDVTPIVPGHGAVLLELSDATLSADLIELFNHDHQWMWFCLKTVMLSELSWAKVVLARRQTSRAVNIGYNMDTEYHIDAVSAEIARCSSRLWELARKLESTVSKQMLKSPDNTAANRMELPVEVQGGGVKVLSEKPSGDEHPYRFECDADIVRIFGFGEEVSLARTKGVNRLIAILTRRRVKVMELARIGVDQGRNDSAVDVDADRLSERESLNLSDESQFGDAKLDGVYEAIKDMIEKRDTAEADGKIDDAAKLTEQIDAALERVKTPLQKAAQSVKKTLDRTYGDLRKDRKGIRLAAHFETFVERPRSESDFIYIPDESQGKIVWILK